MGELHVRPGPQRKHCLGPFSCEDVPLARYSRAYTGSAQHGRLRTDKSPSLDPYRSLLNLIERRGEAVGRMVLLWS